jgi:hypothetical protein
MTQKRRRTKRAPRNYRGEYDGQKLAAWLNGEEEKDGFTTWQARERPDEFAEAFKESRSNVLWVIKTIRELTALAEKYGPAASWTESPKDIEDLEHSLTVMLSDYSFSPTLGWVKGEGFKWDEYNAGHRPADETWMIRQVVDLSKDGLLDRIRKCSCNRWFFARFAHQVSCSSRCRRNLYEKTDSYRAHRRKKAREYYWLHKTKNTK